MNLESLKQVFRGDVDVSTATLEKYSHDASLFEVRPQVVVFPKDSKDIQELVKWVSHPLTPSQREGKQIYVYSKTHFKMARIISNRDSR